MTPAKTHNLDPDGTIGARYAKVGLWPAVTNPGQRPPLFVSRDEFFYWTAAWQTGERESAAEFRAGQGRRFTSRADLLGWLQAPGD